QRAAPDLPLLPARLRRGAGDLQKAAVSAVGQALVEHLLQQAAIDLDQYDLPAEGQDAYHVILRDWPGRYHVIDPDRAAVIERQFRLRHFRAKPIGDDAGEPRRL